MIKQKIEPRTKRKVSVKSTRKFSKSNIIYIYATPQNKQFIKMLSMQLNMPESELINQMIEAVQQNKKLNLSIFVPTYVRKASDWTNRFLSPEKKEVKKDKSANLENSRQIDDSNNE